MTRYVFLLIQLLTFQVAFGQHFEVRTIDSDNGYVEVQIRETTGAGLPTVVDDITDLQFEIRWLKSYGNDLDVSFICGSYNLTEGLGSKQSTASYFWRVFAADQVPFHPGQNWSVNQWESVGKFKVTATNSNGNGSFELPANSWVVQGMNFGIDGKDYTPEVYSNVSNYSYPTTIYDYVWIGGASPSGGYNQNSWTNGANWEDVCGATYQVSSPPAITNKCIIPTGLAFYPTNFNNKLSCSCMSLLILSGAFVEVPANATLTVSDEIRVKSGGLMRVKPGGTVVNGH